MITFQLKLNIDDIFQKKQLLLFEENLEEFAKFILLYFWDIIKQKPAFLRRGQLTRNF